MTTSEFSLLVVIAYVLASLLVVGLVIHTDWPAQRSEQVLTSMSLLIAVAIVGGILKLVMLLAT